MSKLCIIPDVHARQFWKGPCLEHKDEFEKIIFLGDFLAPYPQEKISNKKAIEVFKEILEFKKENPGKVILLLGNHDFSFLNYNICECRTDLRNWKEINKLFLENIELFDLAWETTINGKRYFFSHAGVRKGWLKMIAGVWFKWDDCDKLPPADIFNNFLHVAYDGEGNEGARYNLEELISMYSFYRGWGGYDFGSIVWADIREYSKGATLGNEFENVVFVCGHTQLENEPIIKETIMDLDCRKPFVLDTETGEVKEYVEN